MNQKQDEKIVNILITIVLIIIISILGIALYENVYGEPIYYKVTTYNLDGSKNTYNCTKYETHEFNGTYSFYDKSRYVQIPIKNTIVEQLLLEESRKVNELCGRP